MRLTCWQVDGDFGDVNREIKKIITKDSNVAVRAVVMNKCDLGCIQARAWVEGRWS